MNEDNFLKVYEKKLKEFKDFYKEEDRSREYELWEFNKMEESTFQFLREIMLEKAKIELKVKLEEKRVTS